MTQLATRTVSPGRLDDTEGGASSRGVGSSPVDGGDPELADIPGAGQGRAGTSARSPVAGAASQRCPAIAGSGGQAWPQRWVRNMNRRTRTLTVTVAGAAAAGLAAVAARPAVRREARRAGQFARPLRRGAPLAPVPPWLPPGRVINLPGRGEVFVRDSGGIPAAPAVLLLHGFTVSADLNFIAAPAACCRCTRPSAGRAGNRTGHGRGRSRTRRTPRSGSSPPAR